jgi:hypothetical protein|tara:strand:- start:396 stop:581 length:186 start_codon:yes stop_codon:yes gene_type:complete
MQTSREDRIALKQTHDQMNRVERMHQSYSDEFYGREVYGDDNHNELRNRERNYGLEEEEEW